jgi:predicted transcriptional regulator of viral defense system
VTPLDSFLDRQLSRGRTYFTREDALRTLPAHSLTTALSQLIRKGRIANPRHGFYLILRPEDAGAPDPAEWIHPLMKHQGGDYRVSLLTAAQHHGAATEASQFQVIVPRQLRDLAIGRHRLEFVAQAQSAFTRTNRTEWLVEMKTGTSVAIAAGIELTLLDCARWFHKAGGISAVAQITRALGARAQARRLGTIARAYENSAVRRLGYLLELAQHEEQAKALDPFAQKAKTKLLDPTSKLEPGEMSGRWKIAVNNPPKP